MLFRRQFWVLCLLAVLCAELGSASTFEELAQAATAARQAQDVSSAIESYSAAVQANPAWDEGWWYLGTFLFGSNQFAPAALAFGKFVALAPGSAQGWAFKALTEIQTGEYQAALADMNRSVQLGISSQQEIADVLKTNRAMLLSRLGRYDQALRQLAVFVAAGQSTVLVQALGIAGLRRPLLPAEVTPSDTPLVQDAGNALYFMLTGDTVRVGPAFQLLSTRYPLTPGVHYLVGYYLFGQNPQQAAAEFQQELQIAPNNAAASAMLAYTKLLQGEKADAWRLAQSAVRLDPNSPAPEYVLGRVLVDSNKLPEAVLALEKAVQLDPDNVESRIELAVAYVKAGRYQDGKHERQEALRVTAAGSGL